jgi:hypothetical protein
VLNFGLNLLADKMVELNYCFEDFSQHSSSDSKKNELKPHLKKSWCIGQITVEFIGRIERLLWLYAQEYDPRFPTICYDERSVFFDR